MVHWQQLLILVIPAVTSADASDSVTCVSKVRRSSNQQLIFFTPTIVGNESMLCLSHSAFTRQIPGRTADGLPYTLLLAPSSQTRRRHDNNQESSPSLCNTYADAFEYRSRTYSNCTSMTSEVFKGGVQTIIEQEHLGVDEIAENVGFDRSRNRHIQHPGRRVMTM